MIVIILSADNPVYLTLSKEVIQCRIMNQVALFQEASAFTKFGSSEPGLKPSSQGNRFTSQPYTYSKYLKHTNTYDSSSSQPTSSYSKQLTDFKMMSSTLNYCLSSQVQMANALIEIGKYLKEHNESHSNATISTRAKPTILSTTPSSLSSNIRFQRVKEKPAIDLVLPSIMAKLEEMQSGILSKAQEYEKWQRNQYPSVAGHCSSTTLQPTTVSTDKENAKDSSQSKEPTQSKIIPSTQTKPLAYSPSRQKTDANAEGFLESISNIQLTHPDAPDDSSMFSKCDDLNIFESTITNHNVPAANYDMLKPSKNFERPSQKADIFTPLTHKDLATKDPNNTKQITTTITTNLVTNPQTTQANSVTNNSSKKIVVPPIKLKLGSNPAPLNSPGYKYSSYKAPEHQRHYSEVQSYRNTLGSESENIEFVGDHESKPLQGGTYKTERTARDSTKRLSYLSARELVPQESARLRLSTLPQKEVIDEGIESAQGDQTMQQIDISLLSIDEKPHQTPWMMYLNTDRSTENMKTPMEDALLIMAKKERETIRALMKEQYGPDASLSYHKGNLAC